MSEEPQPQKSQQSPILDLHPGVKSPVGWFTQKVRDSFPKNLHSLTVYGPAVTSIFDAREHQIHHLIVLHDCNVDQLLRLAKFSKEAVKQNISPPLIVIEETMSKSCDVFPLEWLDIAQFHKTIVGETVLATFQPQSSYVRLQCERDLRSLDVLLQRGILSSGGDETGIGKLEAEASDSLIRVLRGIDWLAGDREHLLPNEVCEPCEKIIGFDLAGCREAIRFDGQHNIETVRLLLNEIGQLSKWIDDLQVAEQ